MAIFGTLGCQTQQQPAPLARTASVLDVRPVHSTTPRFSPPSSVAAPPDEPAVATVFEPSQPAAPLRTTTPDARPARSSAKKSTAASASAQQVSYKVKKGDTLYRIARTEYGDGKKWTLIASANPGVSPQSLKAGQMIVIP